jgi:predicted protein tyrosine phosphatase
MSKIKIKVLSKPEFNQFMGELGISDSNVEEKMKDVALISINDTEGNWSVSWFDQDHPNVIRMWFDDVERDEQKSPTNSFTCRTFTAEQAEKLFNFIKANSNKDFIVHCSAGISRSGAVGAFINDYLDSDKEYFREFNLKRIYPNAHVSRLLNNLAWNEQSDN